MYFFRNGHWQFVQKYIMHNTAYPKATGGTPIVSWIPNQIKAVIRAMEAVVAQLPEQAVRATCVEKIRTYKTLLNKQLQALNIEGYKPEEIYQLNKKQLTGCKRLTGTLNGSNHWTSRCYDLLLPQFLPTQQRCSKAAWFHPMATRPYNGFEKPICNPDSPPYTVLLQLTTPTPMLHDTPTNDSRAQYYFNWYSCGIHPWI